MSMCMVGNKNQKHQMAMGPKDNQLSNNANLRVVQTEKKKVWTGSDFSYPKFRNLGPDSQISRKTREPVRGGTPSFCMA